MKKIFSFALLLQITFFSTLKAQNPDLDEISRKSIEVNKKGMMVLGSWAVANIGTGIYGALANEGPNKYFYEMNAIWNGVNLGLAGFSLLGYANTSFENTTLADLVKQQHGSETAFIVNAGLDVGYMAFGLYLRELSLNDPDNAARWKGYGNSILLQGGFLFVFDVVMYGLQRSRTKQYVYPLLENVSISPTGMSFKYTF